ncbi:hypothetical protein ACFX2C_026607 [Malus domestica]
MGLKGNFATAFPSNSELSSLKTTKRTRAIRALDLNLKSNKSWLDSLRLLSTQLIFLFLDFLVILAAEDESVFMVSSFLATLLIKEQRHL